MDWFSLLLIVLFFVLPLLEQLLAHRRRKEEPPREEEPLESLEPPVRRERHQPEHTWEQAPRPDVDTRDEVGWSAGWRDWPGLPPETEEEEPEPILLTEIPTQTEVERVEAPVVSLEPLHVDRGAEHRRFHEQLHEAVPTRRPAARLRGMLRGREDLRRAILLAEVLGAPRALRPGDPQQ